MTLHLRSIGFVIVVLLLSVFSGHSQTLKFVKTTGSSTNSGSSWDAPYASIYQALSAGATEIYIAAGTYVADATTPGSVTYPLPNNFVLLKGGFPTNSTGVTTSNYNPITNQTFLDNNNNNTFLFSLSNTVTTIQGFTMLNTGSTISLFSGGVANGVYSYKDLSLKANSGVNLSTIITDATTTVNYTNVIVDSRGTSSFGGAGTANLDQCFFINNGASFTGAVYKAGTGILNITHSGFCDNFNNTGFGGAIGVEQGNVNISYSFFNRNRTKYFFEAGGAIFAYGMSTSRFPRINLDSVIFYNNGNERGPMLNLTGRGADLGYDGFFFKYTMQRTLLQAGMIAYNDAYFDYGTAATSYNGNVFSSTTVAPSCQTSIVLPLTGLHLTGILTNQTPQLQWVTLTETNSAHFEIEKSTDGVSFTAIKTIAAAGNSSSQLIYSYQANFVPNVVHYFRIKAVDKNGNINYSNTIALTNGNISSSKVSIFPNPVRSFFTIQTAPAATYWLELYNMQGKQMLIQKMKTATGLITVNLNRATLSAGVYQLKLRDEKSNTTTVSKLILE